MLVWFAAGSLLIVATLFDGPNLDMRIVVGAAVLPVLEGPLGGPWLLHTLAASAAALLAVMVATRGHRDRRQRWLGVPIGLFVHLLLDGTWARTDLFWWPLASGGLGGAAVPEFEHLQRSLALEAVGMVAGMWTWRRYGLSDPERRGRLWSEGRLPERCST